MLGVKIPEKSSTASAPSESAAAKKRRKKKKKKAEAAAAAEAPTNGADDGMTLVVKKGGKGKKQEPAAAVASEGAESFSKLMSIGTNAALIIGARGAVIEGIQRTSGAKLDILKNTPSAGVDSVRITAPTEQSVSQAAEQVQIILDEEAKKQANKKSVTLSATDIKGSEGVKAIIGRGGQNIKEIQSICPGVSIDANVDEGTVVVSGPKEHVDAAVKMCKEAVFGEAQDSIDLRTRSAVNIIFGKGFATIRELQNTTGARLDIEKGGTLLKISGKAEQVAMAKQAVTSILSRSRGISMEIDAANIGAVYGKAGSNIRNIQDRTGAFVEVNQQPGALTAMCSIMGDPAAVSEAHKMIQRAIDGEIELGPGEVLETLALGSATPAVIGKGGSKVKELETAHGVVIKVNGDTNAARIVGKREKVKEALDAIQAIIEPILLTEKAQAAAQAAVASGDSAWQATSIPPDEDGW